MHILLRVFLAIYLAHLLTDFVFQTHALVEQKKRGKVAAYLLHGAIHYLLAVLIVGFLVPASIVSWRTHVVVAGLTLTHLLIDLCKIQLTKEHRINDGLVAFVSDQLLHFSTIALSAWLISPTTAYYELASLLERARTFPNRILFVPVIYVGVVFGGGFLIRFLTKSLAVDAQAKDRSEKGSEEQLQNAGLYIGWLERFLVLTALLLQSPATVGLILTAKSIARYPEFESERFAEYFLIGTLLSISLALLGGVLLSKLLFGHVKLSG
jgi:Protein of unknown function (DUF3307)